jgi:urate oxidase
VASLSETTFSMASSSLALHHHGKSRVRVARVWREGDVHHMVEWTVKTMIDSDMEHAFMFGDNTGMTPTDTQKHTVSCIKYLQQIAAGPTSCRPRAGHRLRSPIAGRARPGHDQ